MHRLLFVFLLATSMLVLAGCELESFGSAESYKEDFHQSHALKAGGRLYIENFNGSVEITGWDQETADVSGTKYASTPELRDALKVDIVASGDTLRIRTIRPSGHRGNMGARYVIKVPRKTELERVESSNGSIRVNDIEGLARLHTSNASIHTVGLRGSLEAHTSNGSIQADDVRGALEAVTSNASIKVRLSSPEPGRPIKLDTSNGSIQLDLDALKNNDITADTSNASITVRMPANVGARVLARTSNASVTTDFDVTMKGTTGKSRLEGTIGGGGPLLDLSTSNGSIKLMKM